MIYRIDVTQEDIDHGQRHSCVLCPVALAITRITGKAVNVLTTIAFLDWTKANPNPRGIRLPPHVTRFIFAFDIPSRPRPKPISFLLDTENTVK